MNLPTVMKRWLITKYLRAWLMQLIVGHSKLSVLRHLLLQFFLGLVLLIKSWNVNFGCVAGQPYPTHQSISSWMGHLWSWRQKSVCAWLLHPQQARATQFRTFILWIIPVVGGSACGFLKSLRFVVSGNIHEPPWAEGYSGPSEVALTFN